MFLLPNELQDYIYLFDDNIYYKNLYKKVMSEIVQIYKKNVCNIRISIRSQYDIYLEFCNPYFKKLSFSEYIKSRNKSYGIKIDFMNGVNTITNYLYIKKL